jgi:hypothetical protein
MKGLATFGMVTVLAALGVVLSAIILTAAITP